MTKFAALKLYSWCAAAALSAPLMCGPVQADMVGRILGDRYYEDVKGKFIDVAVAKSNEVLAKVQKDGRRGYVAGSVSGTMEYDAVTLPAIKAHCEKILNKLLAQWPGEKPAKLNVVVTANPLFGAESSSSQTISISQAVLRNVESDDELAAIIGHELAHILLNHFARSEAFEREAKFISDASEVATMGVLIAGSRTKETAGGARVNIQTGKDTVEEMIASMMIGFSIQTLSAMINADWAREQEEEADLLGVDLMARAGYNVEAATKVLDRLRRTREKAKIDLDKFAEHYGKILLEAAAKGGMDGLEQGLIAVAADAVLRGAKDLLEDITKSHSDPQRRWEDIGNYIAREYQEPFEDAVAESNRKSYAALMKDKKIGAILDNHDAAAMAMRAIQSDKPDYDAAAVKVKAAISNPTDRMPYTLRSYGKYQMVKGNGTEAVKALTIAAKHPGASFATVTLYASALAQTGKWDEAHGALKLAEERFGSKEALYPARMELYRRQGDDKQFAAIASECFKLENKEIRAQCSNLQGDGKDSETKACQEKETGFGKILCGIKDL